LVIIYFDTKQISSKNFIGNMKPTWLYLFSTWSCELGSAKSWQRVGCFFYKDTLWVCTCVCYLCGGCAHKLCLFY